MPPAGGATATGWIVQNLHDSADQASQEAVRGHVGQKSDDIQQARGGALCRLYFTKQLVNRGALSPRRTIHVLLTAHRSPSFSTQPIPRGWKCYSNYSSAFFTPGDVEGASDQIRAFLHAQKPEGRRIGFLNFSDSAAIVTDG